MEKVAIAAGAGAAVGVAAMLLNRSKKGNAKAAHEATTLADLEKQP